MTGEFIKVDPACGAHSIHCNPIVKIELDHSLLRALTERVRGPRDDGRINLWAVWPPSTFASLIFGGETCDNRFRIRGPNR